jgi:hypothetical protein
MQGLILQCLSNNKKFLFSHTVFYSFFMITFSLVSWRMFLTSLTANVLTTDGYTYLITSSWVCNQLSKTFRYFFVTYSGCFTVHVKTTQTNHFHFKTIQLFLFKDFSFGTVNAEKPINLVSTQKLITN